MATDIAEWLVRQGVPFRVAHEVAACVRECESRGIELWDLSDEDLRGIHEALTPGVREVLSVAGSLASPRRSGRARRRPGWPSSCATRVRSPSAAPASADARPRVRESEPAGTERDGLWAGRCCERRPGPPLPQSFFDRAVLEVAPDLLGALITHERVTIRLTEVEAYDGKRDPGSHAYRGMTPRTEVMSAGRRPVRLLHSRTALLCESVCGPQGMAAAVLPR